MDDLKAVLIATFFAHTIEYVQMEFNLSPFNIILFINMIGLYYIIHKLQISVRINYNAIRFVSF